jgi:two-component system response regulator FixJ
MLPKGAIVPQSYSNNKRNAKAMQGNNEKSTDLFIVEDDEVQANTYAALFANSNLHVHVCRDGTDFLGQIDDESFGVILLDLILPDTTGLQILDALQERGVSMPVIILSSALDYETTRTAFKRNAYEVLRKDAGLLNIMNAVYEAALAEQTRASVRHAEALANSLLDQLSERETEILDMLFVGLSTKDIANRLDIAPRTVDVHRSNILRKLKFPSIFRLLPALTTMGYFTKKYDVQEIIDDIESTKAR